MIYKEVVMLKNKVHPALNQKVNNNPFYQNIIGKVDSLINLFRDEFKLIVNKKIIKAGQLIHLTHTNLVPT